MGALPHRFMNVLEKSSARDGQYGWPFDTVTEIEGKGYPRAHGSRLPQEADHQV